MESRWVCQSPLGPSPQETGKQSVWALSPLSLKNRQLVGGPVLWGVGANPEPFLLWGALKRRSHTDHSPIGWPEGRDLSPPSSQAALEENLWVWSWKLVEYQRKLLRQEERKPQTPSSQPHKQDGVLTGSPFPKVIEEESLGGQRRLNFLYLLPSEFATNLTSRELFPRVPPLQRRPARIRRLRDLGDGTPLQYSCLENPMDGGAWQAAVHGVAKSRT